MGWDDDRNILLNPYFSSHNIEGLWQNRYLALYAPIVYSIWSLFFEGSATSALPYHALNISFHLMNIILVYFLLSRITQWKSAALLALATAFFALHPLQVETVAWITGFRDILSIFFILLAIHANFSKRAWLKWWAAPLLFALSLLCKPATITVPLALWLIQLVKNPKSYKTMTLEYLSWVAVALPIFWLTSSSQIQYITEPIQWWQRVVVATDTIGFYLEKFIWPLHLNADYGRTPSWLLQHLNEAWPTSLAVILLLTITAVSRQKTFATVLLFFCVLILPVTGLVSFAYQQISTVADRYMYLPLLPLAWGFTCSISKIPALKSNRALISVFFIFSISMGGLSIIRVPAWSSNEIFFSTMLKENPDSFSAHLNLAALASQKKNVEETAYHINEAHRLAPNNITALLDKYVLLTTLKRYSEVLDFYKQLSPETRLKYRKLGPVEWANFLNNVATAQYETGSEVDSLETICEALRVDPTHVYAQNNLSFLKNKLKRDCGNK